MSEISAELAIIAMSVVVRSGTGVLLDTVPRWQACCLIKSISIITVKCQVFLGVPPILGAATVCGTLRFDDADTAIQVEGTLRSATLRGKCDLHGGLLSDWRERDNYAR